VDTWSLPNGLTILLLEDHELPLVSGTVLIRAGSFWDPPDRLGLATITAAVLRSGGSLAHPGPVLDDLLDDRGASLEAAAGRTALTLGFGGLATDLEDLITWLAEILRAPRFPEDKLALAQQQIHSALLRRNDDPQTMASREFAKRVYGTQSAAARTPDPCTLARIQRSDVVAFYQRYVTPDRMVLGLVGDFETEAVKALIQARFGDWPAGREEPEPQVDVTPAQPGGTLVLINRPDLTQTTVQLGQVGGRLDDPDFPALDLLNTLLNGLGGQITNQVRSQQGLSYNTYGRWQPQYTYPGLFVAGGQTRPAATAQLIESLQTIFQTSRTQAPTAADLDRAREGLLNRWVFQIADRGTLLDRLLTYRFYGYPDDFLQRYQTAIQTVTPEQVQAAAGRHLLPPRAWVGLILGPESTTTLPQGWQTVTLLPEALEPETCAPTPDSESTPLH
ncbi:MAG: insulinase family protein, partial [Gloeomargaritaceae cyanobacterium C42_A2020_066]|nr:insulinase family protein [Gloeomargaritaceae cyanobacterium C42_A2020_066]